jgi:hypothetical protein
MSSFFERIVRRRRAQHSLRAVRARNQGAVPPAAPADAGATFAWVNGAYVRVRYDTNDSVTVTTDDDAGAQQVQP